jgi:hypothetical protein
MLISAISRYPEFEKNVKMERSMEEGEEKKKKKKMSRKNYDEIETTPKELKKEEGNKLMSK